MNLTLQERLNIIEESIKYMPLDENENDEVNVTILNQDRKDIPDDYQMEVSGGSVWFTKDIGKNSITIFPKYKSFKIDSPTTPTVTWL